MNQQERMHEIECFKSTLRRGLREHFDRDMTEAQVETLIYHNTYKVLVPLADVDPDLELPNEVTTLVDFELRDGWYRGYFDFFLVRRQVIDGEEFAIYEV